MKSVRNKLTILAGMIIGLFAGCSKEESSPSPIEIEEAEVLTIPIVVHVVYHNEEFNISEEKIRSQIEVLNKDFRKKNPDYLKTPDEFMPLVADIGIEFELAKTDPDGKKTNGITRTFSEVDGWDGRNVTGELQIEDLKLYFSQKGGHDAWPADKYLNIWVTEMTDRHGKLGLPGYAQAPGKDPRTDGVVIDPRVFGTIAPLAEGHALGRTATHEIGHWLDLHHIFGNGNDCNSTDLVDDTPPTSGPYLGTPSYPQHSCGSSSMFMNFMDYVNDESMYMFTEGQKKRMRAVFSGDGGRNKLYTNLSKKKKLG